MPKRFVRRSWGWYLVLLNRRHFKVKLLRFKAHHACSMQYHHHRSELWLFLRGDGEFWRGGEDDDYGYFDAHRGDSIVVDVNALHRYVAKRPTLVLEIQYGEKCEEEDIVRV